MSIKSLYPDIRPSLLLDFANARQLDPRITFTRNSTATYVGRDGLIKTAGIGQPRFDHHPTTDECLGLLIEENRTNQISVSDFSSGWNTANATLVSGISDPEGGTNARKLVTTTANGTAACFITYNTSITSGNVYTQSVWAKANASPVSGNAFYVLQMAPSTGFDSRYQNFDLSNGTLGTGDVDNATIEAFPNGWYRCSVTQTAITTASGRIAISPQNSPTDTRLQSISTGSANNDGIYVWGAQLEVGSFPTSYIPTSGSTVTRVRDAASITGTNFSDWYNPYEVSVVGEYRSFAGYEGNRSPASYPSPFTIDNTATTRLVMTYHRYDGQINAFVRSGAGDTVADLDIYSSASSVDYGSIKYAFASSNADGFSGIVNDGNIVTDTTVNMPTDGVNRATIGGSYGSNTFTINGTIKKLAYYPKRLTDAQLQTLTK